MLAFNRNYFGLAILIFIIEILIGLYIHDTFVRPYLGDVLVCILIYSFIKTFLKWPVVTAAIFVLIFSFTIEFLQLVNIIEKLGLENSKMARTVIGTSFSWIDLISYTTGIVIILFGEKYWFNNKLKPESSIS